LQVGVLDERDRRARVAELAAALGDSVEEIGRRSLGRVAGVVVAGAGPDPDAGGQRQQRDEHEPQAEEVHRGKASAVERSALIPFARPASDREEGRNEMTVPVAFGASELVGLTG
jgi:hypothetical protein